MKLKLTKDLSKLREEAFMQIRDGVRQKLNLEAQDSQYAMKLEQAQSARKDPTTTTALIAGEAELKGLTVTELCSQIISAADQAKIEREKLELRRIKAVQEIKQAKTVYDIQNSVDMFFKDLGVTNGFAPIL